MRYVTNVNPGFSSFRFERWIKLQSPTKEVEEYVMSVLSHLHEKSFEFGQNLWFLNKIRHGPTRFCEDLYYPQKKT